MSNSKADDGEKREPNIDIHIIPALLNKMIENIEDFYDTYIKNKYTKIIKHKAMTPSIQKLEEIYTNFLDLHNLLSISEKSYVGLLLKKYIQKSWVLLLRSKNRLFDIFKQWLFWIETLLKEKLGCLQANGGREFISNTSKFYYQKRNIKIEYATLFMQKENGMAKRYWRILAKIKDILLINSSLLVNFGTKTIDISNYLQNRLITKYFKYTVIP